VRVNIRMASSMGKEYLIIKQLYTSILMKVNSNMVYVMEMGYILKMEG
jgi:hypothetical protein